MTIRTIKNEFHIEGLKEVRYSTREDAERALQCIKKTVRNRRKGKQFKKCCQLKYSKLYLSVRDQIQGDTQ